MNRKKIVAILMTSLLVTNLGANMVNADINDQGYLNQYVQMYQSEPISENPVPKSEMKATATSAQSGEDASKAIDGSTSSLWHTPWSGIDVSKNPQSITLDLGKVRNISSIHVTPRQSGNNGIIKDYKIYAGDKIIAEGTWKTDATTKYIILPEPVSTDNIRIEALSSIGDTNNTFVSIAEVDVFEATDATTKLASTDNLVISGGQGGDLSEQLNGVKDLEEGTAIIRFTTNGSGIQSLFSISNNTKANEHFHVYVNGGQVGYELRKQSGNVSTGVVSKGLNPGINTIAFRAQKNDGYSIYLNGEQILNNNLATANFLKSLEGVNTFKVGTTDRASGSNEYNFTGKIDFFEMYDKPLADRYLKEITGQTKTDDLPLPEGAVKTEPIDLFAPGQLGSNNFRIPALYTTKDGTVLASIDVRKGGGHDAPNNIDTGIKRSTDGGVTWDEGKIILDYPGSSSAIDTAMVQDEETGRIFLIVTHFAEGYGFLNSVAGSGYKEVEGERYLKLLSSNGAEYTVRENGVVYDSNNSATNYTVDEDKNLYQDGNKVSNVLLSSSPLKVMGTAFLSMIYSDDDGETWSKPIDLNKDLKAEWMRFFGTGPGRGHQIKNGEYAGRIVFPIYVTNAPGFQSSAVIYSDDNGETWEIGETATDGRPMNNGQPASAETITNETSGGVGQLTEAQVVEMPNGQLKMFMRNTGGNSGKVRIATSFDGGATWEDDVVRDENLLEPYCQMSVMNYSQKIDGKDAIIFANPQANYPNRVNGTVRIGLITENGIYENGEPKYDIEWKYDKVVAPGTYGYSCLSEMPNGEIGLFYEGTGSREMSFTRMNVEYLKSDLLADAPTAKIDSITSLDEDSSYLPGDTANLKVTFDQTVSLFGDRNLTFIIDGKEVSGAVSKISGNEYKVTVTLPENITSGDHTINIKAKTGLDIVNVTSKVMDLSKNIETTSSITIEESEVVEAMTFNLNAAESVKAGEDLDIKLAIDSIAENQEVFAIDSNLTYDATKFELGEGAITSIDSEKTYVSYKEVEPGKVRIIISSLGAPVVSSDEIVNVKLTAKDSIGVSDIEVAGSYANGEGVEKEITSKSISVTIEEKIVVDTSKLEILISQAEMFVESEYTPETWTIFAQALELANKVISKADATQEEVDSAASAVEKAIKELERVSQEPVYTKHLEIAIEMAEDITAEDLTDVVPVVKKEFKEALQEAKEILAQLGSGNTVTQETVNNSFDRLAKAMQMLEHKGNKTALLALVEEINGLDDKDFTKSSWDALQVVLNSNKVQDVINDENALEADIVKAYDALYDAFSKLEAAPSVNKDILNGLIGKVEGLTEGEYIASTWQNLQNLLTAAKGIANSEAATQAEVDEAYNSLLRAYLELRLKPSKDKLEDLINKAEQLDSRKYTRASFRAVQKALESAKDVFEDEEATKEQIEKAEKEIETAMANLETKESASSGSASSSTSTSNKGTGSSGGNTNLPKTGGVPAAAVGLFGAIVAVVGGSITRKKKNNK